MKELLLKRTILAFVRLPNSSGIGPEKEHPLSSTLFSFVKVYKLEGSVPPTVVLAMRNCSRACRFPMLCESVPAKSMLLLSRNVRRDVMENKVSGIVPDN